MTNEEAIKVLLDEWKCIDRNDGINCDRKCESCDLVMDSFVLKDAYNMAIKALEYDDAKYHEEHGEVIVDKAVWEDAEKALQEPKYCDRNVCLRNEYRGIGCDECEVTKSQESCEEAIMDELKSMQAIKNVFQKLECEHKEYSADSEYMLALWDVANGIRLLPSIKLQESSGDLISRQAVLSKKIYTETEEGWSGYTVDADYIEHLPSVRPQEPKTGHCKDCKWWRDSDGAYRRGVKTESQCPINRIEVF